MRQNCFISTILILFFVLFIFFYVLKHNLYILNILINLFTFGITYIIYFFSGASTNRKTNCDKRKINPNKNESKAEQEILTSKEFDGKALRENKNSSFLDDDWTLKK